MRFLELLSVRGENFTSASWVPNPSLLLLSKRRPPSPHILISVSGGMSHQDYREKDEIHATDSNSSRSPSSEVAPHAGSLKEALFPQDTYVGETYWADLPAGERVKWINSEFGKETFREFKALGSMIKADPLSPIGLYFRVRFVAFPSHCHMLIRARQKYVARGAGLLVEGESARSRASHRYRS